MREPNACGPVKVAFAVLLLALLAGCSGGAATTQLASATDSSTSSGTSNTAPTISGQPGTTLEVGQTYTFQPVANDADGDALTFSVTSLPSWASFDSSTGRLAGTPTEAHIGSYSAITVTVSDGKTTASLAPFEVTVTAASAETEPDPSDLTGSGAATLMWVPPTTNADGTALTDLAGYEIVYGRNANSLNHVVQISNPSVNSYVLENLVAGPWYFAVVAVNAAGNTSDLSEVASKTIS